MHSRLPPRGGRADRTAHSRRYSTDGSAASGAPSQRGSGSSAAANSRTRAGHRSRRTCVYTRPAIATRWVWAVHVSEPWVGTSEQPDPSPSAQTGPHPCKVCQSGKNELKPWLKEQYCLPEAPSGEFVYHMEDVLEVYTRPYDPRRPQVCLDETSVQLVGETRTPVPMAPGRPARYDYEYERNGVAAVFMLTEPLRGWREVVVGDQRTAVDFAQVIKHLVDVHHPDADQIVLVMDQLNTHTPGSLYEAFPPAEAKRLANKLEIHYTPKHGSWLNMAETELSVLTRQCLDRRIPDQDTLISEVTSWMHDRNVKQTDIDWRFTNADASTKL